MREEIEEDMRRIAQVGYWDVGRTEFVRIVRRMEKLSKSKEVREWLAFILKKVREVKDFSEYEEILYKNEGIEYGIKLSEELEIVNGRIVEK